MLNFNPSPGSRFCFYFLLPFGCLRWALIARDAQYLPWTWDDIGTVFFGDSCFCVCCFAPRIGEPYRFYNMLPPSMTQQLPKGDLEKHYTNPSWTFLSFWGSDGMRGPLFPVSGGETPALIGKGTHPKQLLTGDLDNHQHDPTRENRAGPFFFFSSFFFVGRGSNGMRGPHFRFLEGGGVWGLGRWRLLLQLLHLRLLRRASPPQLCAAVLRCCELRGEARATNRAALQLALAGGDASGRKPFMFLFLFCVFKNLLTLVQRAFE